MARVEGSISLSSMGYQDSDKGKICGVIVGRGGSGIKSITTKFPGTWITVYNERLGKDTRCRPNDCDSIYISGPSQTHVQGVVQMVAEIARDTMYGTLPKYTGPTVKVTCPLEAVGAVIGRGGVGIKSIQTKIGDQCHIYFNKESGYFEISASTQIACDRARGCIGSAIREFFTPKEALPISKPVIFSNRFDCLDTGTSDSEDELTSALEKHKDDLEQAVFSVNRANAYKSRLNRKNREIPAKERWTIKEELAKKCDPNGNPLYAPFVCQHRGRVTGVNAVPWSAVDEVIDKRQGKEGEVKEKFASKREKDFDSISREVQRQTVTKGLGDDALFPSFEMREGFTFNMPIGWGTKPSSVCSVDGVDELNEAVQKRIVNTSRKRKTMDGSIDIPISMDFTSMMPSVPKREIVDLSNMFLPTGPKLSRMPPIFSQPDEEYEEFCANEMVEYISNDGDWDEEEEEEENDWWNN